MLLVGFSNEPLNLKLNKWVQLESVSSADQI